MVESFKVVTVDPPQNILLRLLRTKKRGVVGRSRPAYRLRGPRPLVPPFAIGSLPNGFELRFERFRWRCLHILERKTHVDGPLIPYGSPFGIYSPCSPHGLSQGLYGVGRRGRCSLLAERRTLRPCYPRCMGLGCGRLSIRLSSEP